MLARRQWILEQRKSFPIASVERRIVDEVRKNDTLIIVGETGSGKTTHGKVIGITQPRRVAVVTVAKCVAEECNVELGQKVGYSIRFEDVTSSSTRIKYMTDGLLLSNNISTYYDLINSFSSVTYFANTPSYPIGKTFKIIEGRRKFARSHSTIKQHNFDIANANKSVVSDEEDKTQSFSTLRACQGAESTSLKLIIMSASLDAGGFSEYFGGAKAVHIQGRQHPVDMLYPYQPEPDYIDATLITIFQVILATNIAKTSVTIPGIKYVIDPGLVKARSYNPLTGMESLIIIPTSKAQALQRSGRAGREGPGKCFRLYLESEFGKLVDSTVPEIKRCNLSNVVLQLKALGVDDIIGFDFMEKPSRMAIVKSLEQLLLLGALTDDYKLSDPIGRQMARLPLDPMYSKALILAGEFKCMEEMLMVVAMLSVESIFYFPREKMEEA
ncbi:putative pre-mRNA-splicing factor ATP-dependent RNA helicase DEAH10-like [Cocos nucifera]|uniref:RNA helicase n=1 Tax=Cocos nucifera TaxID=13894 RepID=A0A8K0I301_COCNU|nr:putative pre-mRNA-splicing factor ATP-dependent RNA helicase DEAH10-like [Cocos nucifera]